MGNSVHPKTDYYFLSYACADIPLFYDEIQCIHAEGRVKPQCCCAQVDAQNPCHATIKEKLSLQPFFCLKITSSHHQTYSAISQLEGFQLVSMLNFLFS